jgi:ABC-type nitrate/sulfonate/bicarbonate transport system substrate-binding protein
VAARKEGHNVIYHISDLGLPSIGMAMHASNALLRGDPRLVQRFVAAMAEAIRFTEQNPSLAREALQNTLEMEDPEALDSVYDAYAVKNVNRSLMVPFDALAAGLADVRAAGTPVAIDGPEDIATNAFAEDLQRSGFLDRLWGGRLQEP